MSDIKFKSGDRFIFDVTPEGVVGGWGIVIGKGDDNTSLLIRDADPTLEVQAFFPFPIPVSYGVGKKRFSIPDDAIPMGNTRIPEAVKLALEGVYLGTSFDRQSWPDKRWRFDMGAAIKFDVISGIPNGFGIVIDADKAIVFVKTGGFYRAKKTDIPEDAERLSGTKIPDDVQLALTAVFIATD